MASKHKEDIESIEVRWSLPRPVVDGLRAAHLIHGDGKTFMEYVADALRAFTPEAFRK